MARQKKEAPSIGGGVPGGSVQYTPSNTDLYRLVDAEGNTLVTSKTHRRRDLVAMLNGDIPLP